MYPSEFPFGGVALFEPKEMLEFETITAPLPPQCPHTTALYPAHRGHICGT